MKIEEIKDMFQWHDVPEEKRKQMREIRANLLNIAVLLNDVVEDCREKSLAITALQTVGFWINSAISRH